MHAEKKNPSEVPNPPDCFISVSFIGPRALASSPCSGLLLSCDLFAVAFLTHVAFRALLTIIPIMAIEGNNDVGVGGVKTMIKQLSQPLLFSPPRSYYCVCTRGSRRALEPYGDSFACFDYLASTACGTQSISLAFTCTVSVIIPLQSGIIFSIRPSHAL